MIGAPVTVVLALLRSLWMPIRWRSKRLRIGFPSILHDTTIGSHVSIHHFVRVRDASIGDASYIATGTRIQHADIGKFCSIGPSCMIGLGKHPMGTRVSTHPAFYAAPGVSTLSFRIDERVAESERITIGHDVWVGFGALILDGVRVGHGSVIAAGAVVTKDVPPYAVVGGVPARVIKYRFEPEQIEALLRLEWWNWDFARLGTEAGRFADIRALLGAGTSS